MSNDAPYLRFFVDDYLGDTGHLTCVEHGAYMQILWACWKRGSAVPERHLQRLVGMTPDEWMESRDTLAEFFDIDKGMWRHGRIREEIEHVESKRAAAAAAGKKSARSRLRAKQDAADKGVRPKASSAEDKPDVNARSTPVERALNGRSTDVQPTSNYVDVDGDVKVDEQKKDAALPTREREEPSNPMDWAQHFIVAHGYAMAEVQTAKTMPMFARWVDDGVTRADVDTALGVVIARNGSPPRSPTYLEGVVADVRSETARPTASAANDSAAVSNVAPFRRGPAPRLAPDEFAAKMVEAHAAEQATKARKAADVDRVIEHDPMTPLAIAGDSQ